MLLDHALIGQQLHHSKGQSDLDSVGVEEQTFQRYLSYRKEGSKSG